MSATRGAARARRARSGARRLVVGALLAGLLGVWAGPARAQIAEVRDREDAAEPDSPRSQRPPEPPPRRAIPAYGAPPARGGEAEDLLWVPRVTFFPLYLVLEFVVRRPVGWLLREIDQADIGGLTTDGAADGGRGWAWGFAPHLRYDEGFVPSGGLSFWARERDGPARLRVGVDDWGLDRLGGWLSFGLREAPWRAGVTARGGYRVDRVFHGVGWAAPAAARVRYARGRAAGRAFARRTIWRGSFVEASARAAFERFGDSDFSQDGAASAARMRDVPGFDGFTAVEVTSRARFDTRAGEADRFATGVGAELRGGWGLDVEQGAEASWARVGAELEVAAELIRDRTLFLRGQLALVEPLGAAPIPFTELVTLGGELTRMPGYLDGRLLGRSASWVTLGWRYGVWAWLDASLFASVGNVFGPAFRDFDVERLRLSAGFALRSTDPRYLTILVALGTEPFVQGAPVTSGRFAVSFGVEP